uniref:Uncharacterized protein n=1 Tax=Lepeophtheirus salmonis TaxID=72036 RepID=A0A0K2VLU8_LEPSM
MSYFYINNIFLCGKKKKLLICVVPIGF